MTPVILPAISRHYPACKKNVVIGNAFSKENIDRIKKSADNNTELFFNLNGKNMQQLMSDSDIAVSAAGQTLYELARTGTPTITLTVVDNQYNNALNWQKTGFVRYIGDYDNPHITDKLIEAISAISSHNSRLEMSSIGTRYVDGKGARRIAETIKGLL